eukprot:248410_1
MGVDEKKMLHMKRQIERRNIALSQQRLDFLKELLVLKEVVGASLDIPRRSLLSVKIGDFVNDVTKLLKRVGSEELLSVNLIAENTTSVADQLLDAVVIKAREILNVGADHNVHEYMAATAANLPSIARASASSGTGKTSKFAKRAREMAKMNRAMEDLEEMRREVAHLESERKELSEKLQTSDADVINLKQEMQKKNEVLVDMEADVKKEQERAQKMSTLSTYQKKRATAAEKRLAEAEAAQDTLTHSLTKAKADLAKAKSKAKKSSENSTAQKSRPSIKSSGTPKMSRLSIGRKSRRGSATEIEMRKSKARASGRNLSFFSKAAKSAAMLKSVAEAMRSSRRNLRDFEELQASQPPPLVLPPPSALPKDPSAPPTPTKRHTSSGSLTIRVP